MDYTMRQLQLFHREAIKADNARIAAGIIATNLGFTGGKAATEAISKLSGCRD